MSSTDVCARVLSECIVDPEKLTRYLAGREIYRFSLDSKLNKDVSDCLGSRFFKKCLIELYGARGIYVDGPKHFTVRGASTGVWIIELSVNKRYK